jgi:hypothetical protein
VQNAKDPDRIPYNFVDENVLGPWNNQLASSRAATWTSAFRKGRKAVSRYLKLVNESERCGFVIRSNVEED